MAKTEIASSQIAAQNNTIRTNSVKTKIDKTQLNSRYRLCNNRDETINHISKPSKLCKNSIRLDMLGWER